MKIKLNKRKTIEVKDLEENHVVVAINDIEGPTILTRSSYQADDEPADNGRYEFRLLGSEFTEGNGFGSYKSVKKVIKAAIDRGDKIRAFTDYRKALKYILKQTA